jgi:hypothetical protein
MAFTRDDWNSLIDDVNNIIRHPPADTDCTAQTAINHVGTSHIWTKTDIQQVQNKIKATCSDISWHDIPALWKASITEEIRSKLGQAWCHCNPTAKPCKNSDGRAEDGHEVLIYSNGPPVVVSNCYGNNTDPVLLRGFINGLQVALPGFFGRTWAAFRRNHYNDGHTALSSSLATGVLSCQGKITYSGNAQIETVSGIGVNCFNCSDIACQAGLDQAQIDLSGPMIFYSTYFIRINAASAECKGKKDPCP